MVSKGGRDVWGNVGTHNARHLRAAAPGHAQGVWKKDGRARQIAAAAWHNMHVAELALTMLFTLMRSSWVFCRFEAAEAPTLPLKALRARLSIVSTPGDLLSASRSRGHDFPTLLRVAATLVLYTYFSREGFLYQAYYMGGRE